MTPPTQDDLAAGRELDFAAWYHVPSWLFAHRLDPNRLGYTFCVRSTMGVDIRGHVIGHGIDTGGYEPCPTCKMAPNGRLSTAMTLEILVCGWCEYEALYSINWECGHASAMCSLCFEPSDARDWTMDLMDWSAVPAICPDCAG